jgi:hypothetical protein
MDLTSQVLAEGLSSQPCTYAALSDHGNVPKTTVWHRESPRSVQSTKILSGFTSGGWSVSQFLKSNACAASYLCGSSFCHEVPSLNKLCVCVCVCVCNTEIMSGANCNPWSVPAVDGSRMKEIQWCSNLQILINRNNYQNIKVIERFVYVIPQG